ncbi:YciI family protein [Amycolatopsis nigrescens]|uniref:YciI family protein n=1 Tax=Amycolatopsis nigrescens TaxID=381445 RepID=UPI0003664AA1|nr:YciI family protein [Amycolatopsis nigrescens]
MPNYVAFLRSTGKEFAELSPDEGQRTFERYMAWSEDLAKAGNPVGGGGLSASKGRTLRKNGEELDVTDGPYTEASEVLGGFLVIEAADLDEAEKIFGSHPHLDFGSLEVRKVGEQGCEA